MTSAISAPVGIGADDAGGLPREPEMRIAEGDTITAGSIALTAIHTPGHTDGSTCFRIGKHLFTGDTLFPGGPGRSRSPEALAQLLESVSTKLFSLEGIDDFYPGHGDDGNLAERVREVQSLRVQRPPRRP